jgi:three-Cys-motif partner protein
LYLRGYVRVAGNGTYIDGFAGNGRIKIKGSGELRDGSATLALKAGVFKSLLFYERPRKAKQLEAFIAESFSERMAKKCRVRGGDFNKLILDDLVEDLIPKDKPCFAFLDPNGTELAWDTVAQLASYKSFVPNNADPRHPRQCKIELWILLNTHQVLGRLRQPNRQEYADSPEAAALDRVMGGRRAWRAFLDEGRTPRYLAYLYSKGLMDELGYRAARPHCIVHPLTGSPQYFMIHASDHPAAFTFMRWAQGEVVAGRSPNIALPGF